MSLSAGTIWEYRTTATASNVNSGAFATDNANFLADLTTDTDTGNTASPVCSSASYNFVAGDVGAWIYIKSGSNWTPGFYQITSVGSNKATVNATIGSAVAHDTTNNLLSASTVLGVATVATPTGGVFGIDYSQQDTAKFSYTDLAGTTTSITSATNPFNTSMVGNIIHITSGTGFTAGWYEIVSVSGSTATIDRSAGATGSSGVATLGGALSMNSTLDDDALEAVIPGNIVFFKSGTYTAGEAISLGSSNTYWVFGYNNLRMDSPTGTSRPVISSGANVFAWNGNKLIHHLIFTGTGTITASMTSSTITNCKFINTSTTASRNAFNPTANSFIQKCEFVSQNGEAVEPTGGYNHFDNCYFHDSLNSFSGTTDAYQSFDNCIFHANRTACIVITGTTNLHSFKNCTFYGRSAKIGTGVSLSNASSYIRLIRNIFSGLTTGISRTSTLNASNYQEFNNFYNNTTNLSNFYETPDNTTTLDPQFENVSEISGTTATSAGSILTQSGGDFSTVVDNESYLHVISGTGVTTGGYLITSHDTTNVTVNNALGTSSAGNIVYFITTGRNFEIGTNLRAGLTVALNSSTISYLDTGAVQREEVASSGGGVCVFIS